MEASFCCLFAVLPECRFCYPCPHLSSVALLTSSQATYRLLPCKHESSLISLLLLFPKKSFDFSGTPVIAKSYPIRTVIQFSICPSIGRQREGSFINPLNNQLGTFLPFARKNFCKLFVNGGYNDKKSRYTAHQISGR